MIIDSSALIAILFNEPEAQYFADALESASAREMSVASFVECSIVVHHRLGDAGLVRLDKLLREAAIRLVPVDEKQAYSARDAFIRFGKGHHPAGLNYGDCFVYALAKERAEPLLCKGADFAKTDLHLNA